MFSFAHKDAVSTCFGYLKESSSRKPELDRRFSVFHARVNYLKYLVSRIAWNARSVFSVRTSRKNEKLSGGDSEVYVHAMSMNYAMKATSKSRGHAQKRLMDNHIRACPWWAFATIAHRSSSGPESERFKSAQIYGGRWRWWLMALTYDAEQRVVGANHRCIKCTVRSI